MMKRYNPENKCPLCGKNNDCNVAGDCWCSRETFPEEILALVPEPQQRKACICINCLKEYKKNSDKDSQRHY
ncbi:cysteine-rich CWC family protein [Evansella clarkii]|uniref:cysteine-rich CWC family protein n=1 Tax=Evansella clarkii TaxID=79879 RepID=UPI001F2CC82C|nr:cysteine-rich CWC family protein [Evansella clarkii]